MSRKFSWFNTIPLASLLAVSALAAEAKEDINRPSRAASSGGTGRVAALCLAGSSRAELDINNVRAMVLNGGDMWWDLNNPQYEVPKVNEPNQPRRHSIFAGALWIGGEDDSNNLYVAAQTYRQAAGAAAPDAGFWPGPLDDQGATTSDVCAPWNTHAKINKTVIDQFRAGGIPSDPSAIPDAIREWPAKNNPYLLERPSLDNDLAPFIDVDGDGNYDPLRGDYPSILGDQAIWWVVNDAGGAKEPQSPPIGLEDQVMAFAFQTSDLLNNMTFYRHKVINKGQKTLNRTWIGQWVDPDLGYFNDDFVGCDVGRGLGLCYNGDDFDEGVSGYGNNPPTVSVDFFEGPLADPGDGIDNDRDSYLTGVFNRDSVDEPGEKIIMSNFVYYNNDFSVNGNPTTSQHFYNYLRSKITTGPDLLFGGDGLSGTSAGPYAFMFPAGGVGQSDPYGFGFINPTSSNLADRLPRGNAVPPFAWSETNTNGDNRANVPADRRFLQSAGPFTLRPGNVTNITVGVVWTSAGNGGAQGSVALNLVADDLAQELFLLNFEPIKGPPAPIVRATELDQQIILSIQPGTGLDSSGRQITSEDYTLTVKSLSPGVPDRNYKFEGYLVYETIRENVQGDELDDPNKARLIARGDLVNGVTSIANVEFDTDVNAFVPRLRVDAEDADKGIFHTLNITTTQFPAEDNPRLVNFKRYFFKVVPYSYNEDLSTDANRAIVRYLPGNLGTVTAIPAKPGPRNNGTVLNAAAYDQVAVNRVLGMGAGASVIDITDRDEQDIVREGQKLNITYKPGRGPINVRIYSPDSVKSEQFTVKFSSRLAYRAQSVQGRRPDVNDIIVSTGQYDRGETGRSATTATPGLPALPDSTAIDANGDTIRDVRGNPVIVPGAPAIPGQVALVRQSARIDRGSGPQIPGRAIVRRIVGEIADDSTVQVPKRDSLGNTIRNVRGELVMVDSTFANNVVVLEIEMLNDHLGGTFTAEIGRYEFNATDSTLKAYEQEFRPFEIEGGAGRAIAQDYTLHDLWKWRTQGQTNWNNVVRRVTEINEELIPEYGLSIQVRPGRTPGYRIRTNTQAQFLEATLTHTGQPWLTGVPYEKAPIASSQFGVDWLQPTGANDNSPTKKFDPNNVYTNSILPFSIPGFVTLGGTWAAYTNTLPVGSGGARYNRAPEYRLNNLHNVDVVFTSEKLKWTRVPVLQINAPNLNYALTKRGSGNTKPSVNQDGQPDGSTAPSGQPSTGMGWFPGYAIDIDRGIRLNMMFAESSAPPSQLGQGPDKGADLIWEPGTDKAAGRNFIYVTDTPYDEGRVMERVQDSSALLSATAAASGYQRLYDQIMWVGYPRLVGGRTLLQSDARVRIRVDRAFTSYPAPSDPLVNTNPEYTFSLNSQVAVTNQRDVACDALSMVRVVPNPYYAFSQYEERQLDNIVKVTNLPRNCTITIYTLNGTLVRRLRKDNGNAFLDYDLKNDNNLPIASGIYLFHVVDKVSGCEQIVKWFGVLRPTDLESF